MKTRFAFLIPVFALFVSVAAASDKDGAWISLFNGKDLSGWKATEEGPGSFTVEEGVLKIGTGRAHLFYGADGSASFKNFEFKAKVKTTKGSNSGIYIHTAYEPKGWPSKGYECQVNSTHTDRKKPAVFTQCRTYWIKPQAPTTFGLITTSRSTANAS